MAGGDAAVKPSEVRLFLEPEGSDEDPLGLEIGCSVCEVPAGIWCGLIPSAYGKLSFIHSIRIAEAKE